MNIKTSHNNSGVVKPFLKWAGGKSQLLVQYDKLLPQKVKGTSEFNYFEPFLGSGALFFYLYNNYKLKSARLTDINKELISTFHAVQQDVEKLISFLQRYQEEYLKLNPEKRKEYYYKIREKFNLQRFKAKYETRSESLTLRAAQVIFLNRTCYNGLFRMNSKGEFNSPAGAYKNPRICDVTNLTLASKALQKAEIAHANYSSVFDYANSNDYVYFDPPYRPLSKTANFTAYNHSDFKDEDQVNLANLFKQLHKKGAQVMLSNSDPKNTNKDDDFFDALYEDFNIYRIPAKRIINSNAKKRGKINEIVITNY